jgi:mono/diheme cytochrome c family protein
VFAGAKRGDGIWMFSLQGTMRSLPAGAAAGGASRFGPRPQTAEASRPVDVERGRTIYAEACVACHGEAGDGGHGGGPTLIGGLPAETIEAVARDGRNTMPAFGGSYGAADLRDVAAYITGVLALQ